MSSPSEEKDKMNTKSETVRKKSEQVRIHKSSILLFDYFNHLSDA